MSSKFQKNNNNLNSKKSKNKEFIGKQKFTRQRSKPKPKNDNLQNQVHPKNDSNNFSEKNKIENNLLSKFVKNTPTDEKKDDIILKNADQKLTPIQNNTNNSEKLSMMEKTTENKNSSVKKNSTNKDSKKDSNGNNILFKQEDKKSEPLKNMLKMNTVVKKRKKYNIQNLRNQKNKNNLAEEKLENQKDEHKNSKISENTGDISSKNDNSKSNEQKQIFFKNNDNIKNTISNFKNPPKKSENSTTNGESKNVSEKSDQITKNNIEEKKPIQNNENLVTNNNTNIKSVENIYMNINKINESKKNSYENSLNNKSDILIFNNDDIAITSKLNPNASLFELSVQEKNAILSVLLTLRFSSDFDTKFETEQKPMIRNKLWHDLSDRAGIPYEWARGVYSSFQSNLRKRRKDIRDKAHLAKWKYYEIVKTRAPILLKRMEECIEEKISLSTNSSNISDTSTKIENKSNNIPKKVENKKYNKIAIEDTVTEKYSEDSTSSSTASKTKRRRFINQVNISSINLKTFESNDPFLNLINERDDLLKKFMRNTDDDQMALKIAKIDEEIEEKMKDVTNKNLLIKMVRRSLLP